MTDRDRSSDIIDPGRHSQISIQLDDGRDTQITEKIGRNNKLYGQGIYGNGPYNGVN